MGNFGGDSMVRISAVSHAGGWSADTINAEDIDLSFRVRALGWKIVRLEVPMTLHDVGMVRFAEYWRRSVRAGYGYAEVGLRYWPGEGAPLVRRMLSAYLYAVALPVLAVVGVWTAWPLATLVAVLYVRVLWAGFRWSRRPGVPERTRWAYTVLNVVCKFASSLGATQYFLDRALGRKTPREGLIVYRG